ncbi:MAG: DUF547 domain-containing protein [Miltoncostaeaceae bacterium]
MPALVSRVRAPFRVPRPRPARAGTGGREPDHALLTAAVDSASDGWTVDYPRLAGSTELAAFRAAIAGVDADRLDRVQQLRFWINAYNATVLGLVVERWPIDSVAAVPGAFTALRFRVAGREMTLDEIEHGKARRMGDPYVHYGLNCGARGCPPMRAYGEDVELELADNGRRYLADRNRGARADGERVLLSRIHQWFGGDFAPLGDGPSLASTLLAVARPHRVLPAIRGILPEELRATRRVGFLDYDWSVNSS